MFVAFRALRRIEAGEALTVDLRVDPRTHRRYTSPHFPTRCFERPPEPVLMGGDLKTALRAAALARKGEEAIRRGIIRH